MSIIQSIVFFSFTYLFCILFSKDLDKYKHKITATAIKTRPDEARPIPCITFCSLDGFKSRSLFNTNESYLENTYGPEDFFDETSLYRFRVTGEFLYKELHTFLFGRCYTICGQAETLFYMRVKFNSKIFVHNAGDEFWLTLGMSHLLEFSDTILELKRTDGINTGNYRLFYNCLLDVIVLYSYFYVSSGWSFNYYLCVSVF